MTKLVADLGGVGARAYIKTYGGKPHIVLKGHAGLRTILTGTKYGIQNPKVISMGLGKASAVNAAKQGGILTVVLLTAYRVADYFLTDQTTLSQLIGTLATDVVKVGIVTGASIAAATAFGALTFAVGPIVAVVVFGLGVSALLDHVDKRLGVTNRVIAGLDELGENAEHYLAEKRRQALTSAGKVLDEMIDYAVGYARAIAVSWVRRTLSEYLLPKPRAR